MTYQNRLKTLSREYEDAYGFGLPCAIPDYRNADVGSWSVRTRPGGLGESYLAENCVDGPHHVLSREGEPWMSTAMLEIESHAWHLHCSAGNVLIAGLGMGMFLHAVAAKEEVKKVVVLEIDPDVIDLFKFSSDFDIWPHREKIVILNADALSPTTMDDVKTAFSGSRPDYLYVDIWPVFPAAEAPEDTRKLVEFHRPVAAGWWGQEVEYGLWTEAANTCVSVDSLEDFFRHHGVDVPVTQGYAGFCEQVVEIHLNSTPDPLSLNQSVEPGPFC